MTTTTTQQKKTDNERGLAVIDEQQALAETSNEEALLPVEFLASMSAQIEADIKSLTVDQVISATSMLGKTVNVHDVLLMTFAGFANGKDDDGTRVVFEVSEIGKDLISYVAQNPIGSRLTFVRIFENARKAQKGLTITNCEFKEVGKGKFGNKPIILSPTSSTKPVFS